MWKVNVIKILGKFSGVITVQDSRSLMGKMNMFQVFGDFSGVEHVQDPQVSCVVVVVYSFGEIVLPQSDVVLSLVFF